MITTFLTLVVPYGFSNDQSHFTRTDKLCGWISKCRGKYRFSFLKNASKRSKEERSHIDEVTRNNADFSALEIIKEGMTAFFDSLDLTTAKERLTQIGKWIDQKIVADMVKGLPKAFAPLAVWYKNISGGWETLKNYFDFRVTSALAEGTNNVIKALKRRSFGFRNMDYFKLGS